MKQHPNQKYQIIFLFLIIGFSSLLNAQFHDIQFEHITTKEGLPASTVRCIYQDSKGLLWFGTESGGLCKYDGYHFTVYKNSLKDSTSISSNWIYTIFEDSQNILWAGTINGLNRFNREDETFTHYTHDENNPESLSDNWVSTIIEDDTGTLFVGTRRGLNEYDRNKDSFIRYSMEREDRSNWYNYEVRALCQIDTNLILTGLRGLGLNTIDKQKKQIIPGSQNLQPNIIPEDCIVTAIQKGRDNSIWIGSDRGLYKSDLSLNQWVHYQADPDNLITDEITCLWIDTRNYIWIGSDNGLCVLDPEREYFHRFAMNPADQTRMQSDYIRSVYQDKSGVIWIATKFGGLSKWSRSKVLFEHWDSADFSDNTSRQLFIQTIFEDLEEILYVGSRNSGLFVFDRYRNTFQQIQRKDGIASNSVTALLKEANGNLWIGTNKGLNRLGRNSNIRQYMEFSDIQIINIQQDFKGNILLGTSQGAYRYHSTTDSFQSLLGEGHSPPNMQRVITSNIIHHPQGIYWIGTSFKGLIKVDMNKNTYRLYNQIPDTTNTLINNMIRSMIMDHNGMLWIGTKEGLNHFNPRSERFTLFREKDGLTSNTVHGLQEDSQSQIWISTNNGLSKLIPSSWKAQNYNPENGCPIRNFLPGSSFQNSKGEIFFGGVNGFISFHPDSLDKKIQKSNQQPVIITAFKVFDHIVEQDISENQKIELSYRDNYFSFEFAHLDFNNPSKNSFAYKLDGLDSTWIYSDTRRYVNYTMLPPDQYTFQVKAGNADGIWNEAPLSITISINPPFWQTIWFRFIVLVLIVYFIYHLWRDMHQKHKTLAATSLAQQAQLQMLQYQINPHFLFNALNSTMGMIYESRENAIKILRELSRFLRYSLSTKTEKEVSLSEEIKAVKSYLKIEKFRFEEKLNVEYNIEPEAEKCQIPAFFIQPIVENAIKYGKLTSPDILKIIIKGYIQNNALHIDIANTGKLYHDENKGLGIGIKNIKDRLNLLYPNQYTLDLFEKDGHVHAIIIIQKIKKGN